MWSIHAREAYSAIRRKEVLINAMTGVNLEHVTHLSEKAIHKPSHNRMISCVCNVRKGKSIEPEGRMVAARG